MDVLSDVITVMRTGEPRSARAHWRGPFGQRFASVPGAAGFRVVLRGSCWLLRDGSPPVRLQTGDVVFFPHGGPHALADDPTTPLSTDACGPTGLHEERHGVPTRPAPPTDDTVLLCGAYQLDTAHQHPLLTTLPDVVHLPASLGRRPDLDAAIALLGAEIGRDKPGTDALVPALLDTLLLYVLRAWLDERPDTPGWPGALADGPVSGALTAIHTEPARPWTVDTLAATAGLSRAAFARRFTTLTGRPPSAYLTWWRMTSAARLLRASDAPLSTIARRVGYRSEFAFAAAFKRAYGTPPGRYRNGTPADGHR